jgi:hypothetical protein
MVTAVTLSKVAGEELVKEDERTYHNIYPDLILGPKM